jgi:hypothetical protein
MKRLLPLMLLLALAMPLTAQQLGAPPARRRAQLEGQLMQRFAQQAGRALRLAPAEQARLGTIVQDVANERRNLNQAATDLRRRLTIALRDTATTDVQFEQLLQEQRSLRQREKELGNASRTACSRCSHPGSASISHCSGCASRTTRAGS